MSTAITLPPLPPEPAASAPWADRMRWVEAAQREAHIRATIRLAEAQEAARLVMEQQVEQARRMADLLAQPPAPSPAQPAPDDVAHMVALVGSMTSTQRGNAANAAQAAADQLAAIKARV